MNAANERTALQPQPGKQSDFLESGADLCFYGGSAGSGKSYALLLEPFYDIGNPAFRSLIFRRTVPRIRQPGGLLDTSEGIYAPLKATLNANELTWTFPSGATVKFSGMELEQDRYSWQGSQLALIAFDEVQEFAASQFWFMLSRLRSVSGVRSRIRATANPDADSWLRNFLASWIDPDSGFPIKERSGVWRWFIRNGEHIAWADTREELLAQFGDKFQPKSVTFINANIHDNRILMTKDPSYLSSLAALPLIDRARLLEGNWNIRATAGNYFRREWFGMVDAAPVEGVTRCRYWDRAATEKNTSNDPDATVGLLLSKDRRGIYHIEDVRKMFASPHKVEEAMLTCAQRDPAGTIVAYMQDPGSAGKAEAQTTARMLDGYNVRFAPATGDKETRAKPVSAQSEAGNVKMVRGPWNDELMAVLENFPAAKHDDEVDALSGAHGVLSEDSGAISSLSDIYFPPPPDEFSADGFSSYLSPQDMG